MLLGKTAGPEVALGHCLDKEGRPVAAMRVPVRFRVREDGTVTATAPRWPDAASRSLRACATRAFGRVSFTCPFHGQAIIDAVLDLSASVR